MNHTASPTEAFIEAAASLMELSQEVRQHLSDHLRVRPFDPRQLLLRKDHAFDGVFFIYPGRVRGLRDAPNGKEVSAWFLAEGDFIPPVYNKPDGSPAFKAVEMLEESTIVWLNRGDLGQLYDLFPKPDLWSISSLSFTWAGSRSFGRRFKSIPIAKSYTNGCWNVSPNGR
uniref:Crp/Fnr family transcriptional regulator n=1 Tax=Persicitalea sp. TaxID=3100273 RepID=UPI0035941991